MSSIGNIVEAVLNGVVNVFNRPVLWRRCPPNYEPGEDGKFRLKCYPIFPYETLKDYVYKPDEKLPVENQVWEIINEPAQSFETATARNCAPNLIPYEGKCHQHCPAFTEKILIRVGEFKDGKKEPDEYGCATECEQAWHGEEWNQRFYLEAGAISPQYSQQSGNYKLCYHLPAILAQTDDARTINYTYLKPGDRGFEAYRKIDRDGESYEQTVQVRGIVAVRSLSELSQPIMAGTCLGDNIAFNGACWKKPPRGFGIGYSVKTANVVYVKVFTIPNSIATLSADKTELERKTIDRKPPLSLFDVIIALVTFTVIALLFIKFLTSRRR